MIYRNTYAVWHERGVLALKLYRGLSKAAPSIREISIVTSTNNVRAAHEYLHERDVKQGRARGKVIGVLSRNF